MEFIDSHSHIDFAEFDEDRSEMFSRASQVGVKEIIVSATTEARWQTLKNAIDTHQCHAAYGLHPMFMDEHKPDHLDRLKYWLETEKAVAVGEIGLDYFFEKNIDSNAKKTQLDYLSLIHI